MSPVSSNGDPVGVATRANAPPTAARSTMYALAPGAASKVTRIEVDDVGRATTFAGATACGLVGSLSLHAVSDPIRRAAAGRNRVTTRIGYLNTGSVSERTVAAVSRRPEENAGVPRSGVREVTSLSRQWAANHAAPPA